MMILRGVTTKVRQLSKNRRDVPGKEKAPTLTVKGPFPRSRLQMRFRGEALQYQCAGVG